MLWLINGDDLMKVISYGGGIQSTALILLSIDGVLEKPDAVIFSDTGSEMKSTYDTVNSLEQLCKDHDINFVRVQMGVLHEDYIELNILPRIGNSSCTMNYKIRPIRKWLRKNQDESGIKPYSQLWLGITIDEERRARESDVQWVENRFPLLELNMTRDDCSNYIKEKYPNLNVSKSGCFHCPYSPKNHWVILRRDHPDLFSIALDMEKAANEGIYRLRLGLFKGKSIDIFNYSHQLSDFGFELDPVDFDCSSSGGCFL